MHAKPVRCSVHAFKRRGGSCKISITRHWSPDPFSVSAGCVVQLVHTGATLLTAQSLLRREARCCAGKPLGSSAKRPQALTARYTQSGQSSGLIKAQRRQHAGYVGGMQLQALGLPDHSNEPFLPALYSPKEPVRYLAPTGYT